MSNHDPQTNPGTELTPETIWNQTLKRLRQETTPPIYDTWVKDTQLLGIEGDTALVGVASEFTREWLERRMYNLMVERLGEVIGREVEIQFIPERRNENQSTP